MAAGADADAGVNDAGFDKMESELWCRSIFLDVGVSVDADNFASVVDDADVNVDVGVAEVVDEFVSAAGSRLARVGAKIWSLLTLRALTGSSGGIIRPLPASSLPTPTPTRPFEADVSCGKLVFFFSSVNSNLSKSF